LQQINIVVTFCLLILKCTIIQIFSPSQSGSDHGNDNSSEAESKTPTKRSEKKKQLAMLCPLLLASALSVCV